MITRGSDNPQKDVQIIIGKVIKKNVQLHYSGAGRIVKGKSKKSFKNTQTYKYMEGIYIYIYNVSSYLHILSNAAQ